MNWQDPAAIAGYIGVGASGLLALILKARKVWVRDNRDVTYDAEQTKWVEGLQSEIRQLRNDKEEMFKRELQYVRDNAELKAMNEFLTREVERMRAMMSQMEASMLKMKSRLQAIDNTLASTTDNAPLSKN
jgi:biopolymer transport protein ExbB/TolQ